MALFKPHMLPLRSVRSLSTMLGLVLNSNQAKNLFGKVARVSRGRYQDTMPTTHLLCLLTWLSLVSSPPSLQVL